MAKAKTTSAGMLETNPPDFKVITVNRKVRTYRLQESELDHISDCNSTSEWFGKATFGLGSLTVGLLFDIIIQGSLTEFARGVLWTTIPVLSFATIACGFKWHSTHKKIGDFKASLSRAEDADLG